MKDNNYKHNEYYAGKQISPEDSVDSKLSLLGKEKQETKSRDKLKKDKEKDFSFTARESRYFYKDLVLPDRVVEQLKILKSMIDNHLLVYENWRFNEIDPYGEQTSFNLYGPPGTGKTMIVEALASEFGKKIIDVDIAQLESKYVGETSKNIVKAFNAAREQDAVLLFDEADTVLGRRLSNVTQSADASVNSARGVMLKELEKHRGIVAFATNFACNYDPAFTRRILMHIHVPLPGLNERIQLWKKKIPMKAPGAENIDYHSLGEISEGLAGGDILVCVKNSLFDAARKSPPFLTLDLFKEAIEDRRKAKETMGYLEKGDSTKTSIKTVSKEDFEKFGFEAKSKEEKEREEIQRK